MPPLQLVLTHLQSLLIKLLPIEIMRITKFMYNGCFTAIILFYFSFRSAGQDSFGMRITPNMIAPAKVVNPSNALIFGERRLAFDAGLDYHRDLNKNFSIITGLNVGLVDFNHVMVAPVNAFGNGSGLGNIYTNSSNDNFVYTGLTLAPNYRFKIQGSTLHLSAGPNIRLYYGSGEPDISNYAFNRSTPWNPATDPADFEVNVPSAQGKVRADITTSLTIERKVSARTNFLFGLRYNAGINTVADGRMYVDMYSKHYDGTFSVRSSYVGLDLQLRHLTKKSNTGYSRATPIASDNQDFRRSIFVELLGSSPLLSLNYDMMLKRHHNDGFGVRAGFGLGELTDSDYVKTPRYFSIPIGVTYIIGPKRHAFEAGVGFTAQFLTSPLLEKLPSRSAGNLNLGYRFQPLKDGLLFRLYWAPYYRRQVHTSWAGISFGYSFK